MTRWRFQPVGLRRWLHALTLAALVPALLFSGYAVSAFDRAARAALLDDLEHRSRALQRSTEQMVRLAATRLDTLADSDSAQAGDWPALYEQARRSVARDDGVRAVTLVDGAGDVIFHTGMPWGATLFKAHEPGSVQAALRDGRVSVSAAFQARISPRSVVAVSVPLRQGSQTRYVLRAIILTDTLDRLLRDADLPEGWVGSITDAQGILLARSQGAEQFVGKPASASFLEGLRRGDEHPFKGRTLEGIPTMTVVLPVLGGDWYLGLAVPEAVLSASLDQSLWRLAGFALLWFGLAWLMAHAFGSYLIAQAQALVAAVASPSIVERSVARLRVKEFLTLLEGVQGVRRRASEATGAMLAARIERDEITDLYDHAPCGYHSLDAEGRLLRMNATALGWLGYRWEEVQGRPITDLLTAPSRVRFGETFPRFLRDGHIDNVELDLVRKDGTSFPASVSATALRDAQGGLLSSRSTVFDITERKALEARLDHLARTDTLTGLGNRRDFLDHAAREWQRHLRQGGLLSVFMVDIDHFKQVNDRHGHDGGDRVLQDMSTMLRAVLREVDQVARIGGEEFAVLLRDTSAEQAAEVSERLRRAVAARRLLQPDGQVVQYTVSIGVAACRLADDDIEPSLKRADMALYAAKQAGRDRVCVASSMAAQP